MRKIILIIGVILVLFQIKLSTSFALVLLNSPTPPVKENTPIKMEVSSNIKINHIYKLLIYRSSSLIETKTITSTSVNSILFDIGPYARGIYNIDCGVYNLSNQFVESCGNFLLDVVAAAQAPKKYCCNNPRQQNWNCVEDTTGLNPVCVFTSQAGCESVCKPPVPGGGAGAASTTCPTDPAKPNNKDGVDTALGCVPTNTTAFVGWVLEKVIGIAGGIAFLMFIYGGFLVITSGGDPEKLNSGKEIIVSTLAGLLMIVFSVILLRIIGVDILNIPGL